MRIRVYLAGAAFALLAACGPSTPPAEDLPVPLFCAVSASGAYGGLELSSSAHRNVGALGESTPATANGAVVLESANYRNVTGFNAILH